MVDTRGGGGRAEVIPTAVREAFGAVGPAALLEGGQGTSVQVDDLVLKPDADEEETGWFAGLCSRVLQQGFRLPVPVAARDGRFVVEGWSATRRAAGRPVADEDRTSEAWEPVLTAGRALHRAVAFEPAPAFLSRRADRWAVADRCAWEEEAAVPGRRSTQLLPGFQALVVDEYLPRQLIHGDLSGNVLLDGAAEPTVIDLSPYWRPPEYAQAVVVVDAFLWWCTDVVLIRRARPDSLEGPGWVSLLARAGVFRLLSFGETSRSPAEVQRELPRYADLLHALQAAARFP